MCTHWAGEGALRAPFEPPESRAPARLAGERKPLLPLHPGGAAGGCTPHRESRRPRVVGGLPHPPAGQDGRRCVCGRGRARHVAAGRRGRPGGRRARRLAAGMIPPHRLRLGGAARAWRPRQRPSDERPTRDRRQSDEGGARRGGGPRRRPHEEARRSHRRHPVPQHRRGTAPGPRRSNSGASAVSVSGAASRTGAATPGPATGWTCRRSASPTSRPARS